MLTVIFWSFKSWKWFIKKTFCKDFSNTVSLGRPLSQVVQICMVYCNIKHSFLLKKSAKISKQKQFQLHAFVFLFFGRGKTYLWPFSLSLPAVYHLREFYHQNPVLKWSPSYANHLYSVSLKKKKKKKRQKEIEYSFYSFITKHEHVMKIFYRIHEHVMRFLSNIHV